ncbi:hypothetical protein [Pseudomonas sp.]|uniref:hypothetical protein n=1 Tax=Pseudomonas sp. TaxID=306 RepID=UPI0029073906|nr:hypothetical protein [Pseudomonas sp.]MDU4253843.1 hypothetical protein [Pseudomonas sp.]
MMIELFYAKADSFTVGMLVNVRLSKKISRNARERVTFSIIGSDVDNYGDISTKVEVLLSHDSFYPVFKIRPRNLKGQVGFDIPEASALYAPLLGGGVLITDKLDSCMFEINSDELERSGLNFFSMRGGVPVPIVCTRIKDSFPEYIKGNIKNLINHEGITGTLIGLLKHCEAVIVWSFANGTSPAILSLQMPDFLECLGDRLRSQDTKLINTGDEKFLPNW